MADNQPLSPNSNKRKREGSDSDAGRVMKSQAPQGTNGDLRVDDRLYNELLHGLHEDATATRTAQAALQQPTTYPEPNAYNTATAAPPFDDPTAYMPSAPVPHAAPPPSQHNTGAAGQSMFDPRSTTSGTNKPSVGSNEWHQQRKDNHKEVERRRREVINEGIENLAKMIPQPDKNKGAILGGAIRYIQELQAKIDQFDNERRIFEITQQELTKRNETLRDSAQRAWSETSKWMTRCKDAGLQFDDYDINITAAEALDDNGAGVADLTDPNVAFTTGGSDKVETLS